MVNLSGWGLTARLVSKHFGALGDTVARAIAGFDPETATQADRDGLADKLRAAAQKLAQARADFARESADMARISKLVDDDTAAAQALAQRMKAAEDPGQRADLERQVNMLLDDVEANRAKLGTEKQQVVDAEAFRDEVQQIVDMLAGQLEAFDDNARSARQQLEQARAEKDLQALRLSQQQTLAGLRGLSGTGTALDALTRKAQQISASAEGDKIVADIGQKPADRAAELDAIRKSATGSQHEDTLARLERLSGKD